MKHLIVSYAIPNDCSLFRISAADHRHWGFNLTLAAYYRDHFENFIDSCGWYFFEEELVKLGGYFLNPKIITAVARTKREYFVLNLAYQLCFCFVQQVIKQIQWKMGTMYFVTLNTKLRCDVVSMLLIAR